MSKKLDAWKARQAAHNHERHERLAAQGQVFGVWWEVDGYRYGPHHVQYPTLTEALKKRDEMFQEYNKPVPSDYFERQAHLMTFNVWVSKYEGAHWTQVLNTNLSGCWGIHYADDSVDHFAACARPTG